MDLITYISSSNDTDLKLWQVLRLHLGSRIWAIRERAARLLIKYSENKDNVQTILDTVECLKRSKSANEIHGLLLYCKSMVQKEWESFHESKDIVNHLMCLRPISQQLERLAEDVSVHLFNRTAALDIINDLTRKGFQCLSQPGGHFLSLKDIGPEALFSTKPTSARPMHEYHPGLRRAYAVHDLYKILVAGTWGSGITIAVGTLIGQLMACDQDILEHLLTELDMLGLAMKNGVFEAVLSVATNNACPEDLAAKAMNILANAILSNTNASISDDQLSTLLDVVVNMSPASRLVLKAKVKLQACLLGSERRLWEASNAANKLPRHFSTWLLCLRLATKDTTDLSVRLNAVESISAFIQLATEKERRSTLLRNLDFLLIVYDLLQDDDEEVRSTASQIVSRLVVFQNLDASSCQVLCSLAATERLVRFITKIHHNDYQLAKVACKRLLGSDHDTVRFCHRNTVLVIFTRIQRRANELFAEEKQNLYIDEVRNAKIWFRVLQSTGVKRLPLPMRHAIEDWVEHGLQHLKVVMKTHCDGTATASMGLTFDFETLLLCIRLILLARIFQSDSHDELRWALAELCDKVASCDVPSEINEAFHAALQ